MPQDSRAGSALATATDGCTASATNSGPHQPPHLTLVTTLATCSPSCYPSLPAGIESTGCWCSSSQSSIALPRRICGGRYRCCTGGSGTTVRGSRATSCGTWRAPARGEEPTASFTVLDAAAGGNKRGGVSSWLGSSCDSWLEVEELAPELRKTKDN
jgi:hypothetical protein